MPRKASQKQAETPAKAPKYPPLTPREASDIEALAYCGLPEDQIADYIGTSVERLAALAGPVMRQGEVKGNAKLAQTFFATALGRERKVRQVTKTKINSRGQEVEYQGQEVEQEARPPVPALLVYLVEQRLGWTRTLNVRNQQAQPNEDPAIAALEKKLHGLDVTALSEKELANLEGILSKLGFEAAPAGNNSGQTIHSRPTSGRTH